jgi:hypothetical protein
MVHVLLGVVFATNQSEHGQCQPSAWTPRADITFAVGKPALSEIPPARPPESRHGVPIYAGPDRGRHGRIPASRAG